jgi:3-dehydroquinate dehydratase
MPNNLVSSVARSTADIEDVATEALADLIKEAGGPAVLVEPRGYHHLGLIILDAVFSLRADYDTVVLPLLKRYCDAAPGISWPPPVHAGSIEHTAQDLLDFLASQTVETRLDLLNRQIAPGTNRGREGSVTKVDAAMRLAAVLVKRHNISTREQFVAAAVDSSVKRSALDIRGVGQACWRYLLNLSGVEKSKPDTMILRWLKNEAGSTLPPDEAAELIEKVARRLQQQGLAVTVRQVDHLIWRKASGRSLTDTIPGTPEVSHRPGIIS